MNGMRGFCVKSVVAVAVTAFLPIIVARAETIPEASITTKAAVAGKIARPHVSDVAIKADVKKTLRADRSLDDSRITVKSVRDGLVFLSGSAPNSIDSDRAIRSAGHRPGVRGVVSEIQALDAITVPPGAESLRARAARASAVRPDSVEVADEVIRRNVERALNDLDARENAGIRVLVKDGVVWLTGTVPSWQGNESRVSAARSVTGVRSIINELRVVRTAGTATSEAPTDDLNRARSR